MGTQDLLPTEMSTKTCQQCRRMLPINEFEAMKNQKMVMALCSRCRATKLKSYHKRRQKEKLAKVHDISPVRKLGQLEETKCIEGDRSEVISFDTLQSLLEYLKEKSTEHGAAVAAKFEGTFGEVIEKPNAKKLISDFITKYLSHNSGYKWSTYRLTSSGSTYYATLFCSHDMALKKPSSSNGIRNRRSTKVVACKSLVKITYNWGTQHMNLRYSHINHGHKSLANLQEHALESIKKEKLRSDERMDPRILQAQAQQFLKKILN